MNIRYAPVSAIQPSCQASRKRTFLGRDPARTVCFSSAPVQAGSAQSGLLRSIPCVIFDSVRIILSSARVTLLAAETSCHHHALQE